MEPVILLEILARGVMAIDQEAIEARLARVGRENNNQALGILSQAHMAAAARGYAEGNLRGTERFRL